MKLIISINLILAFVVSIAQEIKIQEKDTIAQGVLLLVNDEEISFYNLFKDQDQYFYTNASTGEVEHVFEPSLKQIKVKNSNENYTNTIRYITFNNKYVNVYPSGVYKTKEDFISKKPFADIKVEILTENSSNRRDTTDGVLSYAFKRQNEKVLIKNVFAISHDGDLYLNEEEIIKNRRRNVSKGGSGKSQEFAKVIISNENFMYAEAEITSSNTAVIIGGALIGGLVGGFAGTILSGDNHGFLGVVWDNTKHDFLLFKNCLQYNKIIQELPNKQALNCKTEYSFQDLRMKVNQSIN